MAQEIRAIFEDLRNFRDVEIYALTIVAIVLIVLNIFEIGDQKWTSALILAVLAVLIYGRIVDRRRVESQIRGLRSFHPDRAALPPLKTTLSEAKHELFFVGEALTSLVQSQQALLTELAQQGCKIKIAIWLPADDLPDRPTLFRELERVSNVPDLERNLTGNAERFKHFYVNLGENAKRNVEIRRYSTFPTVSIIFIDKDQSNALVHVEPVLYKTPPEQLPSFRLRVNDSPTLYNTLKQRYVELWESSEPLF